MVNVYNSQLIIILRNSEECSETSEETQIKLFTQAGVGQ